MRIDGRTIAEDILSSLKYEISKLRKCGIIPHLVIFLIGNDLASKAYVDQKQKKGEAIGAAVTIVQLASHITNQQLLKQIQHYDNDPTIHGIIIQRPLPLHIDGDRVAQSVSAKKDIDAFRNDSPYDMPLAEAVIEILKSIHSSNDKGGKNNHDFLSWLTQKHIVVIGKGETGGGPVISLFKKLGIHPTIVDSKTPNPQAITKQADIIISAVGKSHIITKKLIKQDVILVSIGLHRETDGKLHGDYDEENIQGIASFYTPTPGGIGPVNVAMLLTNLAVAAQGQTSNTY